ncbi:MAG: hypothetical protein IJV27_11905 [Prevotella sp.]|nr:hypothetical protein [Prevotella sp.]
MQEKTYTFEEAFQNIEEKHLGDALQILRKILEANPYIGKLERLEGIENDYHLMLDYMLRGYKDSKREYLYYQLLQRLFRLVSDAEMAWKRKNVGLYAEAMRIAGGLNTSHEFVWAVLERFVADVSLLSLELDTVRSVKEEELYARHYAFMNRLFCVIWISEQWTDGEVHFYEELILSPTIDSIDAQLLVSAIMMATLSEFDINKFRLLVNVYLKAADERTRQRALVGWAFTLPQKHIFLFPDLYKLVSQLSGEERIRGELLELHMQVFYCLDAEKDNQHIQKEIIPTIIKNNNLNITRFGITEKEEDRLEEILHPEAADQRMEKMEESIRKMTDMQRAGSDIYFGGFSQMKHFSFFSVLTNWLCPFYAEHPGISEVKRKMQDGRFIKVLQERGPFCDSDKYSFILAMSTVIDKIPANMRDLLNNEEMMGPRVDEDINSAAYLRRMYLQDLYRLFRLHPRKNDLANPFENKQKKKIAEYSFFMVSELWGNDKNMLNEKLKLGKFLVKRGQWDKVDVLLQPLEKNRPEENVDYDVLMACQNMHKRNYIKAISYFESVLQKEPHHDYALKGLARASLLNENYIQAEAAYGKLHELYPQNIVHSLNYCIVLLKLGRIDESVSELYRLDYESPDNKNVKRALAWGLLWQSKLDAAKKEYDVLLNEEKCTKEDFLNAGYCQMFMGQISNAVELFKKYVSINSKKELNIEFKKDADLINSYGISDADLQLILDLV